MKFHRELTKEESLYLRLFRMSLHYEGKSTEAFKKCEELLKEVMDSDLQNDFKEYFKYLWMDQTSKLYEIHKNYFEGLKMKFERAIA